MNKLYIVGTQFTDINDGPKPSKVRFGYRICADNFMAWCSNWTDIPSSDHGQLERIVVEVEEGSAPNGVKEQFKRIIETKGVIVINGNEYTYVHIDDILSVLQEI